MTTLNEMHRCANCAGTAYFMTCDKCARPVCWQCNASSYRGIRLCRGHVIECSECGDIVRAERAGQCPDCGEWVCEDCGHVWDEILYCERHRISCVYCGRDSDYDGRYCANCNSAICSECNWICSECGDVLCGDCIRACETCDVALCGRCWDEHGHNEPEKDAYAFYRSPYAGNPHVRDPFTFGLEIELDGRHDHELMTDNHPALIAGWSRDGSLHGECSWEYQTQPLTMRRLNDLVRIVERQDPDGDMSLAGGHMHVSRTSRQTPSRWYWALEALTQEQAESLNMRHATDDRWCELKHGEYWGKDTAVNDSHGPTIELRTFGPWYRDTAPLLAPAVAWVHAMWRFFQHHPVHRLSISDIQATSRTAYAAAQPARRTRVQIWKETH